MIDFEMTHRQKQIRLAAHEFAEGEWVPIGKGYGAKEKISREIITKAARLSLSFPSVFIKKGIQKH
jgi:hypothetical protein